MASQAPGAAAERGEARIEFDLHTQTVGIVSCR